ncbi:MAG TPA: ATP-binding protein [Verrucomicrobiae bacterium]|jgi:signal transduction histidine kinase/CheY-like chemotaxis protein|nr:ATP-binding protein [Verrucomicrobiae bacterium]
MHRLQHLPIKRKLTLVIVLASSVVLLLACAALAAFQLYEFRRAMVRDMTVLADVLATNTRAAVSFQDEDAARESLRALQAEPFVMAASIYNARGERLADYIRSGRVVFPAKPGPAGHQFIDGHLLIFRPIILRDKTIGTMFLQADLAGVYQRLRFFGGIALLVLCGSFVLAFILAGPLQRPISVPILALAETARTIAEYKDYTVRAPPQGRNEVGMLTDAFNQMLSGIAERETALNTANETLRAEIAERKHAEGRVQAQLARLELLNQITRAIGERKNLQNIFQVAIRNLEEHLPVNFSCIGIYDPSGAGSLTIASVGKNSAKLAADLDMQEKAQIPVGENGLARCVRGHLVYESDTSQVHFPIPKRLARAGVRSIVVAPLLVESKVFGVLFAGRTEPKAFSSGECEFLKQLSEHIALAAHQAQLYDALQQAYDDLRQTQQAVMQQERLRALGQMASGIAHDINNAISPVALYTESLLENEPNLSTRARGYLETIQHAIEDVAATVARMREFYRQRETQLAPTPVRINDLMKQVIDLSRARWSDMPQQRGFMIKLATEFEPDLPVVMGVESEIREALINLIFNAVDAMPDGGTLTLRTKLAWPKSMTPAQAHGKRLYVEVSDTGVGMEEDTRRRCLEPFFTTKGERGTGLGLAMVYGTVRRHGAEIEIDSAVGRGTTMRLNFPVPAEAVAEATKTAVPYVLPSRLRLLVVDDDPLLIKSLCDILETDGHFVVTANGGQAGIDTFRSTLSRGESFDVVFTDLGMPYVDGRKVASAVKETSPSTPVILLTGWGQRLIIEGDVPPHVDQVLNKPPKLRELREALTRCLRGKNS